MLGFNFHLFCKGNIFFFSGEFLLSVGKFAALLHLSPILKKINIIEYNLCTQRSIHENVQLGSSRCGLAVNNPTSIHEDAGLIPGLPQWVKDLTLS